MHITRKDVEFSKQIAIDRIGVEYAFCGTWNPFDKTQGCDCSGCACDELKAVLVGTAMNWTAATSPATGSSPPKAGGHR